MEEERVERLKIEENFKLTQAMLNNEIQTLRSNLESANRRPSMPRLQPMLRQVMSSCHVLWV